MFANVASRAAIDHANSLDAYTTCRAITPSALTPNSSNCGSGSPPVPARIGAKSISGTRPTLVRSSLVGTCGLDDGGSYLQECVDGQWEEPGTCVEPDIDACVSAIASSGSDFESGAGAWTHAKIPDDGVGDGWINHYKK